MDLWKPKDSLDDIVSVRITLNNREIIILKQYYLLLKQAKKKKKKESARQVSLLRCWRSLGW